MPRTSTLLLLAAVATCAAALRGGHAPARALGGSGGSSSSNTPLSPEDETYLRNSKIILLCVVGFGTLAISWAPWFLIRVFKTRVFDVVNVLSAAAAGVILGALLSHTLPESGNVFKEYLEHEYGADAHIAEYPFSPLIVGGVFILLTFVDRVVITKGLHGHSHGEHGHAHGKGDAHAHDHVHGSAPPMLPAPACGAGASPSSSSSEGQLLPVQHHHISHDHVSEGMRALMAAAGSANAKADSGVAVAVSVAPPASSSPFSSVAVSSESEAEVVSEATALTPGAPAPASPAPCTTEASVISAILKRDTAARAWVFVLALSLHAFFDGLSLGAERTVEGFYSILIAVAAHKAFDGLAVGAAVFPAGFTRTKSLLLLTLAAFMTPLGVIVGLVATESVDGPDTKLAEAIITSLTGGSFLFISLSELLPSSLHDGRWVATKLLGFTLGWAGMVILAAFV